MREGNIGLFVHFNARATSTNKKGCFGSIECWLNKGGVDNISKTPKLEEMGFQITHDRMYGH